jgi:peroxiredoxin
MSKLTLLLSVLFTVMVGAAGARAGADLPDFPPGVFTDGQQYSLADLKGKVVVLYMYEKDCPTCMEKLKTYYNPMVEHFRGKPVQFIAIAAGDNALDVKMYINDTHIKMPIYIDAYSLMERRYGEKISLQNILQTRVIGPDGNLISGGYNLTEESVDQAVAAAKWKYKDKGYDPALSAAVERFEWGYYPEGMRALRPYLRTSKKSVAESAAKLLEQVKEEGKAWKTEAQGNIESNPVAAYDGFTKVKSVFEGDKEMMEGVDAALKKLKSEKVIVDELAARKMASFLAGQTAKARPPSAAQMADGYRAIAKKYPDTPSGQSAEKLAGEFVVEVSSGR